MAVPVLSGKVFMVITGASQGIGEQIAVTFGHLLNRESRVVLLARNLEGLKRTASKMPEYLKVFCESVDLSVAEAGLLEGIIQKCIGPEGAKSFDRAVIVHNAGSIGDLSKSTIAMTNRDELMKYYGLNVISTTILNSLFFKIFNEESGTEKVAINITSQCGIEPMTFLGFYGPGKAAREMYFKIFALEFPKVNVLNYAPGPVETDMFDTLVRTNADEKMRERMGSLRIDNSVLTTHQTVDRLVLVLRDQKYKSGDHIDYYDQL